MTIPIVYLWGDTINIEGKHEQLPNVLSLRHLLVSMMTKMREFQSHKLVHTAMTPNLGHSLQTYPDTMIIIFVKKIFPI